MAAPLETGHESPCGGWQMKKAPIASRLNALPNEPRRRWHAALAALHKSVVIVCCSRKIALQWAIGLVAQFLRTVSQI
eukprot:7057123-Pyramimonas_sp.AAC.1